jgi:hypothetical protein
VSGNGIGVSDGFRLKAGLYKATAEIIAADPPGTFRATVMGPSGWYALVFDRTPAKEGSNTFEAAVTLPVHGDYLWDVSSADGKWTLKLEHA